ncbi:MAG: PspA/IM30 family protein [Pirellulales bacterium]
MKLFQRVTCILSANLNDLVDRCENPEKMLRQAVREMEASFGQLMEAAAQAIAHERTITRQVKDQRAFVERHLQAAEAAVARGDDETARRELRHKSECEQLVERLAAQQQSAVALSDRLRRQVTAMRIKLAEARQKLLEVTAKGRAAAARRKFVDRASGAAYGTAVSNFDRLCAQIEHSEDETEALLELIGEADELPPFDADIEADLAALKGAALKEKANHVATT